ncbi:MAG: type III secretion system chaperone [Paracoccaceae bacterium]
MLGTADRALETLSALIGGAPLTFDADGIAQLTVQDAIVVNLQRLGPSRLRLITYLDGIASAMTARMLLNALTQNHAATGADAAFGLHERVGILSLEDRVDVAEISADAFEARVLAFVKAAADRTARAEALWDAPNPLEGEVHRTGSGMDDARLAEHGASLDASLAAQMTMVRV